MIRKLTVGMQGADVRALQDVLNYHIRREEPLVVDGKFGNVTDGRVREFQRVNLLKVDGIAGFITQGVLYEASLVEVVVGMMPVLELTLPSLNPRLGINPPRLIPPLQLPGVVPMPPNLLAGPSFRLPQSSVLSLPPLNQNGLVLNLTLKVPTRQDPDDPAVRSRQTILQLINDLPVNSKFKAFLITKVPNPVQTISEPPTGFGWGLEPIFDPLDPKGFGLGGDARFTVRISGNGSAAVPNVVVGAWGEGKAFLNFQGQQGQAKPRAELEGKIFLGLQGSF